MRFTHKLTAGFGLVAVLALAMAGLFYLEFKRYERSNHLIFLLDQVRGIEQTLQTSMLLELQAVEDSLERPDPVFTDRAREQARKTAVAMAQILQAHRAWRGTSTGWRSRRTGCSSSPGFSGICRATNSGSRAFSRWPTSARARTAPSRAGSQTSWRSGSTAALRRWSRAGAATSGWW